MSRSDSRLIPPEPGATVEIDVPGAGPVARGVVHARLHQDGTWGLTLIRPEDGEPEFVRIRPTPAGWVCLRPALDLRHAVFVAECVRDGVTLHGPARRAEQLLSEALLQVVGLDQPRGPAVRVRLADGGAK